MKSREERADETGTILATAADGTSVRGQIEGKGRAILIVHPGMDTGKRYARVAARLAESHQVIRLHRRQYRLDLKLDPRLGSPCTVADEAADVVAVASALRSPVYLFGHSSGGTVALEALAASPASFASAMIYEPASVVKRAGHLYLAGDRIERDGELGQGMKRMRELLVSGKPGKAIGIFSQIAAGWPSPWASIAGVLIARIPDYRRLIPCQTDDLEALERLGLRLDTYSKVNVPVTMVFGERSPPFLKETVAMIADVLPRAEQIALKRQGHACHLRDPKQLAELIQRCAGRVFG